MKQKPAKSVAFIVAALLLVLTGIWISHALKDQTSLTLAVGAAKDGKARDFYEAFRLERQTTREQELAYYEELMQSTSSSTQTRREAEEAKLALAAAMEDEFIIESLLLAKGYEDAAVTLGTSGANVVVKAQELSQADTAKILDIVCRQRGLAASQVYIVASP